MLYSCIVRGIELLVNIRQYVFAFKLQLFIFNKDNVILNMSLEHVFNFLCKSDEKLTTFRNNR